MARASLQTILPLDEFARIMGINPAHFNGGNTSTIMGNNAHCSTVWWQYAWQAHDKVGREDLAEEIRNAEREAYEVLGFWPGPVWIDDEVHQFPRHHRPDVIDYGNNVRGFRKSIIAKSGKFIEQGQRAVTLITTPTVAGADLVYSDEDGDGFEETVTLTATLTAAQAAFPTCEFKAYDPAHNGEQIWEIRPARSISISGLTLTMTFWTWQFIDPDIWEALPDATADPTAIDLTDSANLLQSCDIYREYNDTTAQSARFFWEDGPENVLLNTCSSCGSSTVSNDCPACSLRYQDGCAYVRDVDRGIVVPVPATYDSDDGRWEEDRFTICREPDQVKIWYRAGDLDQRFLAGTRCVPMPEYWAQAITWLAATRVERPFCMCTNIQAVQQRLRVDLRQQDPDGPTYIMTDEEVRNPFGTRRGELMAWRRLRKLSKVRAHAAVV